MTKEITQEDIIKNYREVNAEQDYKIRILEAENQRLKLQLDREIHINRKMKRTLKEYADVNFWYDRDDENGWEVAQEVLKEIGEEE